MTPSIVVGGEALVDLVAGGGGELDAHLGGGPFNCARTLGRLEQPVAYLGRISNDRFGVQLRERLEADGVALDCVVATDDPTTLALAELDEEGAATYRFYVDGTSVPGLTPEAALATLPERVEMVHVGTLGLVYEPTAAALEAVVEKVAGEALVMVDLNIRPLAVPDPEAYRARIDRLLPRTDVVKASDDDLAWLDPDRAAIDVARELLSAGPVGGAAHARRRGRDGRERGRRDRRAGGEGRRGRHDRRGRRVRRGLPRLVAARGARRRRPRRRRLGARGDALRLRGRGPHGRARGRLAPAAGRGRYGLTIGFTLRGSSRLARSATSTSSSVKWPVTIASRSTAPEAARAIAAG